MVKKRVKVMTSLFEIRFLAFLIAVPKIFFLNSETKLDKIGMFWKKILILKIWPIWPFTDLSSGQA